VRTRRATGLSAQPYDLVVATASRASACTGTAARVLALAALLAYSLATAASEPHLAKAVDDAVTGTARSTDTYRCGDRIVTMDNAATSLVLTIDGERLVLEHVPAASGAKYRDQQGNQFWSHGERALLELRGQAYPECTRAACGGGGCEGARHAHLGGVPWMVEDIEGRGIIDRSRVTLEFNDDGRVSGHASCNRYSASYTRDGNTLTIGPTATTRMACPPALTNQEQVFLAALARVRRFEIDLSGALVLVGEPGAVPVIRARHP